MLAAAAAGAIAAMIIRGQISRHQRDLFSPQAFKRLAALGHISREPASVDLIRLLLDFIAWEPERCFESVLRRSSTGCSTTPSVSGIEARANSA